jgi:hypothetical protein
LLQVLFRGHGLFSIHAPARGATLPAPGYHHELLKGTLGKALSGVKLEIVRNFPFENEIVKPIEPCLKGFIHQTERASASTRSEAPTNNPTRGGQAGDGTH